MLTFSANVTEDQKLLVDPEFYMVQVCQMLPVRRFHMKKCCAQPVLEQNRIYINCFA
jgi:hypothetical protein